MRSHQTFRIERNFMKNKQQKYNGKSREAGFVLPMGIFFLLALPISAFAIQTNGPASLTGVDSGWKNIPAAVTVGTAVHGSSVTNGVITITWQDDGTTLDGLTATLTPSDVDNIRWTLSGTCVAEGVC